MTGTLHIVVAMKPVEGNFASNAVTCGVGGLNIDECRVKGAKGKGVWGTSNKTINPDRKFNASPGMTEYHSEQNSAGRWPANVVLGHCEGCRRVGEKKVKGNRTDTRPEGDAGREDKTQWRFRPTDATKRGYSDADGNETVEVWECEDGCPVKEMDGKSGVLKSGDGNFRRKRHETKAMAGSLGEPRGIEEVSYGDTGGASRFFQQIKEFNEGA